MSVSYIQTKLQPRVIYFLHYFKKACRLRIDNVLKIYMEILRTDLQQLRPEID